MNKKLLSLSLFVLVLCLADAASAVYLAVDLVCPVWKDNDDYRTRNERTSKPGFMAWGDGWGDMSRHDIKTLANADGSGVDISITVGYEGDGSLKILGMTFMGDGEDPAGLPLLGSGAIANSYFISHRHWGDQPDDPNSPRYSNGSVFVRFSGGGLVKGDYSLTTYHNCPNNIPWDSNSPAYPPDWYVDDGNDSIMPEVRVYGPGVQQMHDETYDVNVVIQHVSDDESLVPSKVKWYYNGVGEVTVMFKASPGSDYRVGGAGVVNAFILEGGDPGMATYPRPTSGATGVHPEVVLMWKPGLYAVKHDVYFSTDFNDVNDGVALVSDDQDPNEYDPPGLLTLAQKYYWRIDEVNVAHPNSPWPGSVWNFTIDDGKATDPVVRHGTMPQDVNLAWTPGTFAVTHDLYFGTDFDDVNDADTASSEFVGNFPRDSNSYQIPYMLELGESYYWRVDENNSVYGDAKGDIWGASVQNYLVIDDFESYNFVDNYITDTWLDGIRWPNYVNGATIALGTSEADPPDPVNGGKQSMWYAYDNMDSWGMGLPYYSEAELPFKPTRNLAEYGLKALVLYFYGDPNADANVPENQMYLTLGDGSGNIAKIDYGHYGGQDMSHLNEADWHEWNLDLEDFNSAGVDITDVNKLIIGFGVPGNTSTPGGLGEIFFDDIRRYLSRCVPEIAKPPMDISGNCKVDMADVSVVVNDWLLYDFTVSPEAPPSGPVLRYLFNETVGITATDSSGNGYHGTGKIGGDAGWEDFAPLWDAGGKFGRCVKIDKDPVSDDDYFIQVPSEALTDNITDALTISAWLKWESDGSGDVFSVWGGTGAGYNEMLRVSASGDGNDLGGSIGDTSAGAGGGAGLWPSTGWNHFAFVKDAGAKYMGVYINGKLVGENDNATATNIFANLEPWPNDQVRIGCSAEKPAGFDDTWRGFVDDFRIYDYGLSQAQVAYIVQGDSPTPLYIPMESNADVYDEEPANSKAVNFRDLALIVADWLDELMWP